MDQYNQAMRAGFLVALVMFLPATPATAENHSVEELVDGILARSNAVFSGNVDYEVMTGVRGQNDLLIRERNTLTWMGQSWRVDFADPPVHRINHAGNFLEVRLNRQPDGSFRPGTSVRHPQLIDDRTPVPPYFAGTFWYRTTAEFVKNHSASARLAGEQRIDGVDTIVLEWDVPKPDIYRAFSSVAALMSDGGVLRLFVSPQLGYALPRIEYVGAEGAVGSRFDAGDFVQFAEGIFIPRRFGYQDYNSRDVPGYFMEYRLHKVDLINEPIPDDAFVINLTKGTVVYDERKPDGVTFQVNDSLTVRPQSLDGIFSTRDVPAGATASELPRVLLIAALNVALVVLIVVVMLVRRARSISKTLGSNADKAKPNSVSP